MGARFGWTKVFWAFSLAVGRVYADGIDDPGHVALEEIVVTAQRRAENLQDVPIAVTALPASALKASGVQGTLDLPTVVPGLQMPESSGYVTPHIRGVGTAAFGAGLENSVAVYVDGVYYASAPASIFNLNNISQVEVLKGPQGTLFGRNATGGLIHLLTADPTGDFRGEAGVGYGSYQTTTGNLYVTGGIASGVDADLSMTYSHQGQGYGRNVFNGADVYQDDLNYSARSKWLLEFDPTTLLRVNFDFSRDLGNQLAATREAPGTHLVFGALTPGGHWDTNQDFQPFNDFKGYGVSVRLDHDFGSAQLMNIAAYRKSQYSIGFDADLTPLAIETIAPLTDNEHQFSEELQLKSPGGQRVTWVAGLYYLAATGGYHPTQVLLGGPLEIPLGPPPAPSLTGIDIVGDQKTTSVAGYGQASVEVAANTKATLGVRYTYERRELDAQEFGFAGAVPLGPISAFTSRERRYYKPTWRFDIDHRFDDELFAYLSYNRGFKSGGFNVGVPSDKPFEPEVLDAYEMGLKMDWWDHRIRINPSIYYYDYKNIQVAHYVLGQVGYYNGAAAQIYGLDMDAEAKLTRNLSVRGGVEFSKSRFTSFPNALIATQLPTGGTDIHTGSATGNELPFAPKGTLNAAVDYRVAVPIGSIAWNVTYYYNKGWFAAPDNVLRQPAYGIANASVTWTATQDRYEVKLWTSNLTNEAVATALDSSAISSLVQYQPPRTYGVLFTTRF
jgi:iron complex outermembrane recepter protein